MARQLNLLEVPPAWRLDDATREVGRQGIAAARASLQAAASKAPAPKRSQGHLEHPAHRRSAA